METADRMWVAVVFGGALYVRDRRNRHKIKALKKAVQHLSLENEFLHAFVTGITSPNVDKAALLTDLSSKFKVLSRLKVA